jgi:biopolymer transport protein ExbD
MNFRKFRHPDEPEINLVPFIDVLLVILIFLMITTTYAKYSELKVNLPTADADRPAENPKEVVVLVSAEGRYAVNKRVLETTDLASLTQAMGEAAGGKREAVVIISADASAAHQAVVQVMEAARRAGLARLAFAAQQSGGK